MSDHIKGFQNKIFQCYKFSFNIKYSGVIHFTIRYFVDYGHTFASIDELTCQVIPIEVSCGNAPALPQISPEEEQSLPVYVSTSTVSKPKQNNLTHNFMFL